jgi:hypothetical protein
MLQNPDNIAGEAIPAVLRGTHPRGGQLGPLEGKETPSPRVPVAQGPRPEGTAPTTAGLLARGPP